MVSRIWRGVAKAACADAYVEHLRAETFPALERMAGFVAASILRRAVPQGVEFLVVTRWRSLEAIRAFAGDDVGAAVVPPKVQEMMVAWEHAVRHYEEVE